MTCRNDYEEKEAKCEKYRRDNYPPRNEEKRSGCETFRERAASINKVFKLRTSWKHVEAKFSFV